VISFLSNITILEVDSIRLVNTHDRFRVLSIESVIPLTRPNSHVEERISLLDDYSLLRFEGSHSRLVLAKVERVLSLKVEGQCLVYFHRGAWFFVFVNWC
jgi:hypothetical protein